MCGGLGLVKVSLPLEGIPPGIDVAIMENCLPLFLQYLQCHRVKHVLLVLLATHLDALVSSLLLILLLFILLILLLPPQYSALLFLLILLSLFPLFPRLIL